MNQNVFRLNIIHKFNHRFSYQSGLRIGLGTLIVISAIVLHHRTRLLQFQHVVLQQTPNATPFQLEVSKFNAHHPLWGNYHWTRAEMHSASFKTSTLSTWTCWKSFPSEFAFINQWQTNKTYNISFIFRCWKSIQDLMCSLVFRECSAASHRIKVLESLMI